MRLRTLSPNCSAAPLSCDSRRSQRWDALANTLRRSLARSYQMRTLASYPHEASRVPNLGWPHDTAHTGPSCLQGTTKNNQRSAFLLASSSWRWLPLQSCQQHVVFTRHFEDLDGTVTTGTGQTLAVVIELGIVLHVEERELGQRCSHTRLAEEGAGYVRSSPRAPSQTTPALCSPASAQSQPTRSRTTNVIPNHTGGSQTSRGCLPS
jgi:hypothetical protein